MEFVRCRADDDGRGTQSQERHPVFQPDIQSHRETAAGASPRHNIDQLAAKIPEGERNTAAVRELAGYRCPTRMHVVRLLVPQLDRENHTKDIDFRPSGIMQRWDAGYAHIKAILDRSPWTGKFDSLLGVIRHEQTEIMPTAAE